MGIERTRAWPFHLLVAALGLVAMVLPRLPHVRPNDTVAGGVIAVGPFSGGLLGGNTMLMSALLVASAGITMRLWPARAWESAMILGLAPTAWMVIDMVLHGPGDIWPIALVVAAGYGSLMVGLGKFVAWLLTPGTSPGAA